MLNSKPYERTMQITLTVVNNNNPTTTSIDPDSIIVYQDFYIGLQNGNNHVVLETRNEIEVAIKESRFF